MTQKFEPEHGQRGNTNIRKTITTADGVIGEWYIVANGVYSITFDVIPDGTAYVETTNDLVGAKAGTAPGLKWTAGDITERTSKELTHMVAFRLVSTSGAVTAHLDGLMV